MSAGRSEDYLRTIMIVDTEPEVAAARAVLPPSVHVFSIGAIRGGRRCDVLIFALRERRGPLVEEAIGNWRNCLSPGGTCIGWL